MASRSDLPIDRLSQVNLSETNARALSNPQHDSGKVQDNMHSSHASDSYLHSAVSPSVISSKCLISLLCLLIDTPLRTVNPQMLNAPLSSVAHLLPPSTTPSATSTINTPQGDPPLRPSATGATRTAHTNRRGHPYTSLPPSGKLVHSVNIHLACVLNGSQIAPVYQDPIAWILVGHSIPYLIPTTTKHPWFCITQGSASAPQGQGSLPEPANSKHSYRTCKKCLLWLSNSYYASCEVIRKWSCFLKLPDSC